MIKHNKVEIVSGVKDSKMEYIIFALILIISHAASETTPAFKKTYLKVGAFNVQHFGDELMSQEERVDEVADLIGDFDIIVILEVRDEDLSAVRNLQCRLGNRYWTFVASKPLGRTKYYKEQIVFYYRKRNLRILGTYQYDDTEEDDFERDPFGVEIEYYSVANGRNERVVLLGVHTKPTDNPAEVMALPKVMTDAKRKFPESSGVIALGDLNADCGYLNKRERNSIDIFNAPRFQSLIGHDEDTTVSNTDCAYDRVVLEVGEDVIADRPQIIRFDQMFGLTTEQALELSDHYPIRFRLN